jgi:hypothetical protein
MAFAAKITFRDLKITRLPSKAIWLYEHFYEEPRVFIEMAKGARLGGFIVVARRVRVHNDGTLGVAHRKSSNRHSPNPDGLVLARKGISEFPHHRSANVVK